MYGMLVGIIPIAGVTTALITVFSMGTYFMADPYLGLVFLTAIVASCASADSYTSILTGIPGASTTAACVIDGYPMAKKGQAARAMGIAITDSTFNGVIFAALTFFLLPYYGKIIVLFGRPEFLGFMMMALACVGFVASKNVFLSIIAIIFGLAVGMVGETVTSKPRLTFGWEYLQNGIGMVVLLSGLFGVPELLDGFKKQLKSAAPPLEGDYWSGLKQGFGDCRRHWKDMCRGGLIGFVTGLLPGVGGAVGDFLAYGATKAAHKEKDQEVPFGEGNPVGLLGCEGANNAQKATSMIPTVLFGIPGASFAAIVIGLFAYLDFELGTLELANDAKFFDSMLYGFMLATVLVGAICLFTTPIIARIAQIPYKYYFPLLLGFIVLACVQYTGGWEDYFMLVVCSIIGLLAKRYKFSRPALLFAFILSDRIEALTVQMTGLYTVEKLLDKPIFLGLCVVIGITLIWGLTSKRKINYA